MNLIKLFISVVGCVSIGFIGSFATASSLSTWYSNIIKPSFNPPSWIFGPVWTILYILMGVSFYLIWVSGKADLRIPMVVFGIQLALNLLWSFLFFGFQNPFLAFIEIIILLGMIITTIFLFFPISSTSAYLLVPYVLWVAFASVLNFSIWFLNR